MIEMRKGDERGIAHFGWLYSQHSFSFGSYHDPLHTGFGPLLVINEDKVQPGRGFDTHGHRDMEIISYVLEGSLEHKDSMGNGSVLRQGDVQRMSAGTGVLHSEFNPSRSEPAHFLQIWIEPSAKGIAPSYEEAHFDGASGRGRLRLVASPDGEDGSLTIHQDARLYACLLDDDSPVEHALADGRTAYLHCVRGELQANGRRLRAGDALKYSGEPLVSVSHGSDAEFLLFDLPY